MGLRWECPAERECAAWALSYFWDCVCDRRDAISFALGVTSLVCWAVAEIPQIVSSWSSADIETVSLGFIFTWMTGDIFNLVGCWIDPAVLPTQFYMAALYFATTFLLVIQQSWLAFTTYWNTPKIDDVAQWPGQRRFDIRTSRPYLDDYSSDSPYYAMYGRSTARSLPVTGEREVLHPLPETGSLPTRLSRENSLHSQSVPSQLVMRPPVPFSGSLRRLALSNAHGVTNSPMTRGLIFTSFIVAVVTLSGLSPLAGFKHSSISWVERERRELLTQDSEDWEMQQYSGVILGWIMTCIYVTGRLPQICLNWSRDFIIGVPVSTMLFAFLCNTTYLSSILVRDIEWPRLQLVLPWVVDVIFCLFVDFFMMVQYLKQNKDGYVSLE